MPEPAVAPPPQLQLPAPADPSGVGSMDIGTDEGALSQASQMANAQPQAPAQPPATPLHSRIADGVLSAFSKSDGTAGGFLRSALAGGLAGLAAASNRPPGNVPRGAAALGGFGTGATAGFQQVEQQRQQALENKQKQTTLDQQAAREKYLNAETQARTYADQIAANNSSEEGLRKRYEAAGHLGDAFAVDHDQVGHLVTEDELTAEGGPGQKYDHTQVSGYNVGEKEVMRDGKMVKVPVFDVYSNKPQENHLIEVTPGVAKVLGEAGYDYKVGDKIPNKLLDSMGSRAMASLTTRDLMETAAAKEGLAEDQVKAATAHTADMATINPIIGAYMAKHPDDFFGGLAVAAGQKGAVGEAAQRIQSSYDPEKLDKIRHERAEEQQKAIEEQNKAAELKQRAGQDTTPTPQTDVLGGTFTPPPGGAKETNKRADSFKKDADALAKTEGTYNQFQDVLNDINSGKPLTGAQSVVALFNAIGISAEPLQGKGFRINNNTVEEHAEARGLGESLYQKFLHLKQGDVITPRQIQDYANIAMRSRHDAYVNKINEARGQGVNPEFLLPRGNGKAIDSNTASIFYDAATGQTPQEKAANAKKAATATGWNF